MNNLKNIANGIYKKEGEFSVDHDFINQLYHDADDHPRNRSRILIHESTDSIPQEMIIAFTDKSIVEVSTHVFPESFTLLEGVAKYIFFDEKGNITGDIVLSSYQNRGNFYCFISKDTFHRFIPYTKYSLAHEIGFSNFSREFTKLYLDKQFKSISARSNKSYSLEPSNKSIKNQIKISDKNSYIEVLLSGKIIFISSKIIEETRSKNKPTIYKINSKLPSNIGEMCIVLLPGNEFKIPNDFLINSFSIINGSIKIKLSDKQNHVLKNNINFFYTCEKKVFIEKIENNSPELAVIKVVAIL